MEGERLELTEKESNYWLGPNLTLRDCTVVIRVGGRQVIPVWGTLINCTIQAKRELVDTRFTTMGFQGCRFEGRFSGVDFGQRVGHGELSVAWPGDFTPVILEGRFKELPSTVARTFYAPVEAKRWGATVEEFKAAVERFDFVVR
jgi:hypothetical protein